ncbi:MAG: hypothetical protein ABSB49_04900 [Polyangia bacterium]|jgi:hypothetical protein
MRYPSKSVIALFMMVVVAAAASKPARAQDSESSASAPAARPEIANQATVPAPLPSTGAASEPPAPAGESAPGGEAPAHFGGAATRSHWLQTGLSAMPGTGYRMIVRYNDNQSCADSSGVANKPVCARRLPTFLDFSLSFGVMARLDAMVDLRYGLEADPATFDSNRHQFAIAPGLRFWLDRDLALKFYTTLQLVYDYETYYPSTNTPNSDFGFRNANGLMYDVMRNVGLFAQFGETLGFVRWFRVDVDLGLGAQLRLP